MTKQEKIKGILERGVEEIIQRDHLEKALNGKKKLRVKLGIDPTSPNIHIGRAVVLWKLRAFQDLGHQVVFIIGDFTGQIGDTSDKDSERPMLTEKEITKNVETYLEQAYKILDKDKTEFHYNSKWLKELGFAEIGHLANMFGLHEFSSRENIAKRLKAGKRVSVRELLYPLMQGYDSVAVKADVELGGTDQRFNLLAGRTIQQVYKQAPQDVMMTELLEGTDGRKMSSSWGNTINLNDPADLMFGKVMSLSDKLMDRYFLLATHTSREHIEELKKSYSNPRDLKLILAHTITEQYHGANSARRAQENFVSQFSKKELPTDIPVVKVKAGTYSLTELLVLVKLASSKSEARRLIEQGGVKINQQAAAEKPLVIGKKNNLTVQVGKRRFVNIA
ncbi:MAG TPA: tyrosine--tRNA ligase [Patescibacteria group bacterium]|jgi:tyrosyl-tRNA synthetase|nr:tyrosine--tRNA ligase [Patescibacteria group bacterium]